MPCSFACTPPSTGKPSSMSPRQVSFFRSTIAAFSQPERERGLKIIRVNPEAWRNIQPLPNRLIRGSEQNASVAHRMSTPESGIVPGGLRLSEPERAVLSFELTDTKCVQVGPGLDHDVAQTFIVRGERRPRKPSPQTTLVRTRTHRLLVLR